MQTPITWITLPDGKRLGPFSQATLYIGSDSRCPVQVTGSGILGIHARLKPNNSTWLLAPEAGAAIFLVEGERRVRRISSETAIPAGSAFALGSSGGLRLSVDAGQPIAAPILAAPILAAPILAAPIAATPIAAAPASTRGRQLPTADALSQEVMRRAEAEAMRNGKVQEATKFWYRWKSGTLFRPDVIVGAVISLFTALCGLCGGGSSAFLFAYHRWFEDIL
jgi:hypothetical protein